MSSSEQEYENDPTVNGILSKPNLKWIFVGGKGGVGKTTTSCAIASLLSKKGKSVLIISTDPAHNVSDALGQKVGSEPTKVAGTERLFAMEISSKKGHSEAEIGSFLGEIVDIIPGIDEVVSFAELMKLVKNMKHDVIVFDTAPTGHTIKLLGFPELLEKGIGKLIEIRDKFSGIMSLFKDYGKLQTIKERLEKLEETKKVVEAVTMQFKNPELTTFVSVCIPEFLSVYETSRLLEVLKKFGIKCECLVVNQVLFPSKTSKCSKCLSRMKMQKKYLMQINNIFDSLSVVTMPLMDEEVRGTMSIDSFSKFLIEPYDPSDE